MTYFSDTATAFIERCQDLIEWRAEYEEQHRDAGGAYAHLAGEGAFDYGNGEESLREYCAENGINLNGVEIDRLAEDVIFWGYMMPGQSWDHEKRFLVASYQVGEIEIQVDAEEIGARFTPWLIERLNRETDAYWRYNDKGTAYAYILSESYWDHVCDLDTIQDLVEQHKQSARAT